MELVEKKLMGKGRSIALDYRGRGQSRSYRRTSTLSSMWRYDHVVKRNRFH